MHPACFDAAISIHSLCWNQLYFVYNLVDSHQVKGELGNCILAILGMIIDTCDQQLYQRGASWPAVCAVAITSVA